MLRIALGQIDPVVGDFEANVKKIKEAYKRACSEQARLLLTPELGLCGYPPLDLMDRPEIFDRTESALEELMKCTQGQKCALVVGHVGLNLSERGRFARNLASVFENGKLVFQQAKTLLPTYDIFDEARYFEPAEKVELWNCDGFRIGVAICEDLWGKSAPLERYYLGTDPIQAYRDQKAQLILSLSSSPYEWGKRERRESVHQEVVNELKVPLVYVNQVGATDEVLFDGASFAFDSSGVVQARLPSFQSGLGLVSLGPDGSIRNESSVACDAGSEIEILAEGLVTGIREYFRRTGFKTAVLGLSGGIDSAVVASLAVRALGSQNVLGVAMPSQYSSSHSLEDAEKLAKNLRIRFEVRPIKFLFSTSSREISERRGVLAPLAQENLQARLRGVILMTLANHDSSLLFSTGNKSELAMGYCTLYGDMAGALAPIGDLYKTRVYALARYLNQTWGMGTGGGPIPESSITKPPSAELRPNQKDQDTLPPYEVLDELLFEYLEKNASVEELEKRFGSSFVGQRLGVREIVRAMIRNEYKRKQAAPVLKVSGRAFGLGRRVPISKSWE